MRSAWCVVVSAGLAVVLAGADVLSQPPGGAPTFEVVSVRRNMDKGSGPTGFVPSRFDERPDGGISFEGALVNQLIARAYPAAGPREIVNLPEWTRNERYDVRATASLTAPTRDDRAAMLRARGDGSPCGGCFLSFSRRALFAGRACMARFCRGRMTWS